MCGRDPDKGCIRTGETITAEQSIGEPSSSTDKPPPSPPPDLPQPETEDDNQCVTGVTHLLLQISLSHGEIRLAAALLFTVSLQ